MDNNEIEQAFIPKGYRYFKVKQATLNSINLPPKLLIYQNDLMKVSDLIKIYKQDCKFNKNAFGSKDIYFALQDVGMIPSKTQIAQVKNKLHNQKIKTLDFIPILNKIDQQFQFQCYNDSQVFKNHLLYKDFQADQNLIEFCIQFTQFHQVYYTHFIASKTIEEEMNRFLKSKTSQFKKDLSVKKYIIKCKGCGQKIDPSINIYFLAHFTIQITFDGLLQMPNKPYMEGIKIKIIRGIDQVIKVIPYHTIMRKKVKSILQQCQIKALKVIDSFGLKILNTVVKPIEFLSKIESSLCVMKQATIEAFIIEQSELFYSIQPMFKSITFDLSQIKQTLQSEQVRKHKQKLLSQIYNKRQIRINQTPTPIHKQSSFIDPILGYTSELYYRQLNLYLRETNFGIVPQKEYKRYQYKFSFALIRSLLKIANHQGIVYRGVQYTDYKTRKGDIISFNSFTSTSLHREKAWQFGKKTFYTIHSLTGKNITEFSYFKTEGQVLFLPYTYFEVMDVKRQKIGEDESIQISLREVPIPRRQQSNILFWVDDDPTQGSKLYQSLFKQYPNITTQIIQLLSNGHLRLWLDKFGSYLKKKIKISLITDMKRGEILDQGLQTIKIMNKYLNNIDVFIYILNIERTKELLASRNYVPPQTVLIGNSRKQVASFIKQKVVDKNQLLTNSDSYCSVM